MTGRSLFEACFLVLLTACFLVFGARWIGAARSHPDRRSRGMATLLFALAIVAVAGDIARDRMLPGTSGFYGLSAALAPFPIAALVLAFKLLAEYRAAKKR